MLHNLKAEMSRYGISTADIAAAIGKSERSVRDKISGKHQFSVPEAREIKQKFFIGMSLEYLFCQTKDDPTT